MGSGIQLVPLLCSACNSPLHGEKEGVFFYCSGCGAGFEPREDQELWPVQVYFARVSSEASSFLPFWVFDAQLQLRERESKKSLLQHLTDPRGLTRLFEERGTIRFYAPAHLEDLNEPESRALWLTKHQPDLEYLHKQPELKGVNLSSEDARKTADFLFVTSEIIAPDTVRRLDYTLLLDNPALISIAF